MELPNLFEFLSFIAITPGALCGPNLEYTDFKNWIELKRDYSEMPVGLNDGWKSFLPAA